MAGLTLAELQSADVDEIHIHSHEGGLYTVMIQRDSDSLCLYGDDGKPLCTRQLLPLRQALQSCRCEKHYLVQKSPYDEMLGMAPSQAGAMKIPLGRLSEYLND